jgi:hypothetical protein
LEIGFRIFGWCLAVYNFDNFNNSECKKQHKQLYLPESFQASFSLSSSSSREFFGLFKDFDDLHFEFKFNNSDSKREFWFFILEFLPSGNLDRFQGRF